MFAHMHTCNYAHMHIWTYAHKWALFKIGRVAKLSWKFKFNFRFFRLSIKCAIDKFLCHQKGWIDLAHVFDISTCRPGDRHTSRGWYPSLASAMFPRFFSMAGWCYDTNNQACIKKTKNRYILKLALVIKRASKNYSVLENVRIDFHSMQWNILYLSSMPWRNIRSWGGYPQKV